MKRVSRVLYILFVLLPAIAFAQAGKSERGSISYKTAKGVWTFTAYTADIIKTTFVPTGYSTGENVSDAVIAKPDVTVTWSQESSANKILLRCKNMVVTISNDSIYFGDNRRVIMAGYNDSAEYRGFKFYCATTNIFLGQVREHCL